MAKYGRGLICLALTEEKADALELPLSRRASGGSLRHRVHRLDRGAPRRDDRHQRQGSRDDDPGRGQPRRAARGSRSRPATCSRCAPSAAACWCAPARPRARSTWRGSPGSKPAGVICEIMSDDGSMARMPELEKFAQKHGLRILSIADLIAYRLQRERSSRSVATAPLMPSLRADRRASSAHVYSTPASRRPSTWRSCSAMSARASRCWCACRRPASPATSFGSAACDCGAQLAAALQAIDAPGAACCSTCIPPGRQSLVARRSRRTCCTRSRRAWPAREHAARLRPRRAGASRPRRAQAAPDDERPKKIAGLEGFGMRSSSACRWRCRRRGTTWRSCATSAIAKGTCSASTPQARRRSHAARRSRAAVRRRAAVRDRRLALQRASSSSRWSTGAVDAIVRTGVADEDITIVRGARARWSCRRWPSGSPTAASTTR